MNDRPVFIAGLDRSGKTRMRLAVASRSAIAMARRAELWTFHLERYGDLSNDRAARRAVEGLLRDRHVAALVDDPAALLRDLLAGPRTYAHLFALVGRQHAARSATSRWGDQTALVERHADAIFEAFPAARVIHMVRDPRDRYASAWATGGVGRGGIGGASDAWNESVDLATRNEARFAGRYLVIRFEDLAQRPSEIVGRVLDLIDVDSPPGLPEIEPHPAEVGIYRAMMPRRLIALMQSLVADGMTRFDYEPDEISLDGAGRWRLRLLDQPWSRALMRGRRGLRSRTRIQSGRPVSGRASS